MAKIIIDARIIYTTTGRYIERLVHYVAQIDQVNEYIILLYPQDMDSFELPNERFSKLPAPYDQFSFAEQFGFARLLRQLKPDLVHFTVPHRPIFYFGKQVTTVHDLTLLKTYNSDKNWLVFHAKQIVGWFVFKVIGRISSHIITPSEYTKNEFRAFTKIPSSKITVTYEGAESNLFTAEPYPPLINKKYLLYVGNQSDYKNIRRLMQAHKQLLKNHPDLLMVFAGKLTGKNGVSLARNREWAEQGGYKNIIYTDFVSDEQLLWLYQRCATYVFPSLMEGFGLPGLEAMAAGAPVASSNATCLPEVYGQAAHYFNPTDTYDIARAIDDILTNTRLRQALITKGYAQVKKYSWRRTAEQTLGVYNKVIKS